MEGALRSIPGIAFSASDLDHLPFQEVEKYVPLILQHVIEHPLPRGSFLNVTFPKKEFKGMKLAKQGRSLWMENPEKRTHPEGHDYYWLGAKWAHCEEEEMSDVFLLKNGFVTAVPIHVEELTDYRYLEEKKAIFEGISKEIC